MTNSITAGKYSLSLEKTLIMGILNSTPDSFSDGGQFQSVEAAIDQAAKMIEEGADIIDIGGESTRPGARAVDLEEELERVLPIIEALAARFAIPLSVDTYKAEVARQALQAGASIINDIWGAKADPEMAQVAKESGAPIILMHNRKQAEYTDFWTDMIADLEESIRICVQAGVKQEQIILDPGVGFGKTYEHNLLCLRYLDKLVSLGYPVLLATSRKSVIGLTLDLPVDQRLEGTIATVCQGISQGCHIVRVHDCLPVARAVKMLDAIVGKGAMTSNG